MYPVVQLDVAKVANALLRAFSRPGISKDYFEKIRDEIGIITVDGGSEFKKAFPDSLRSLFPNSRVNVSTPKNQTFGRPTLTGPIEAAVRMVRKLLRDYGLARQSNLLEEGREKQQAQVGLANIIFASNSMKRAVLNGKSPNRVAKSIINNEPKLATRLTEHMQKYRKKQLLKKLIYKHNNFQLY